MNMIPLFRFKKVHHIFQTLVVSFLLAINHGLFLVPTAVALDDGINRLEQIGFSTMPGNRVQIQVNFAGTAITHKSFSTNNPARIVLDFLNTQLGLKKRSQPIGIGVVQGTSAVETPDRTRVVIKLVRMVPFDIRVKDNRVLVSIENLGSQKTTTPLTDDPLLTTSTSPKPSGLAPTKPSIPVSPNPIRPASPKPTVTPTSPPVPPVLQPKLHGSYIQDIDFRHTKEGGGRITVTLSDPSSLVDMRQTGSDIALSFPNTLLPDKLDRRLDVLDFGTPISFIDTFSVGPNVRMNITVTGDYEHHAYQAKNVYVLEVKEKVKIKQETLKIEERKYEGQLVSFNFQNIDVRAALSLLFDLPGVNLNMVAGDEIKGEVTLRLKNVPWDQALDIILESRALGMRKIGNVVLIDLKKNLDERKQRELSAQKKIKELESLYTEFLVINYAKAQDVVNLLRTSGQHSFLSTRGSVSMDERTNTLIIQDTAAKIIEIRKLIAEIDIPIRQVLIEARIVIASNNFTKDLGVRFGYSGNERLGKGKGMYFGGTLPGRTEFSEGLQPGIINEDGTEPFIVSLPAGGNAAGVGLAIGKIGSYLLQLELSAMQSEGDGEILSSPRVITGNQQEASILQGTEIPYFAPAIGAGAIAQVQFKPAILELKVTPHITPDGRISMELNVKKDSAARSAVSDDVIIEKREVKTRVLVDNGETVVLGGVYERSIDNKLDRVPFLADLPLIGHLFKRRFTSNQKSELLIFVTPKIIKEATS